MDKLTQRGELFDSIQTEIEDGKGNHCHECFIGVEDDLFIPKGLYMGSASKPITFDFWFSITVAPHRHDVMGELKLVNKSISGLSGTTEVEGEGTME